MALNLEKRQDGTFYFRRTYYLNGKQKAVRTSLKTKSYKTARILAIHILSGIGVDKLLSDLLSKTKDIKKFEVEYDENRNIKKLAVKDAADNQNFLEVQDKLEMHRQAEHKRAIELQQLKNQASVNNHSISLIAIHGTGISDLLYEYIESIGVTNDVKSKYCRVIGDFVAFCTHNKIQSLPQVNRKFVFSYLKNLRANNKSDKTIKNNFGVLNTFWNFQIKAGEIETASPFSGHSFDVGDEGREPFSLEELNKIFASDFVTQNQQNKFILLLLLTTGARPTEICQLWNDDIYQQIDESTGQLVWVIRITKNTKRGQTLKTKSSNRFIYLHDLLIQKGFLEFLKSKPVGMLFKLTKPAQKTWSVFFSNDFSALLKDRLHIENKVLYCFRHTTNNRLKNKLVNVEVRENFLGHKPLGTNADDYSKAHTPANLKQLTEAHLFFSEVESINNLV